ncbi:MAG: PadR family transcriptional regulator [Ornithinibacter sp.]
MTSTLGYAILGLLARRPRTGYDLARLMERPVGWFWTASHSQIYPELARLERDELVEHVDVDAAGPRQSKIYSATDSGMAALRAWVASDLVPQPVRDLEVLRLWSLWAVDPDTAKDLVQRARAVHSQRLAAYEAERDSVVDDPDAYDPTSPTFASRVTLEGGIRSRRAAIEWLDWLTDQLAEGSPS